MELSDTQIDLVTDVSRFKVACWARRVGKTYACLIELHMKAANMKNGDQMAILSQTNDSVRKLWIPMFRAIFPERVREIYQQPARIVLKNGVEVHIAGANSKESIDNLRGLSLNHVVIDEAAFIPELEYAVNSVIMPALATTKGTLTMISSPNGDNAFKTFYDMGRSKEFPTWNSHHADHTKAFIDVAEEVELARKTVDPITFKSEWEASFEGSGRNVYYAWDRTRHITSELEDFKPGENVCLGIDFNIGIQAAVVFVRRAGQVQVLDEIQGCLNTFSLAEEISERYGDSTIICYPDPAGNQRRTSAAAGQTDISILRDAGFQCYHHKSTRSVKDGVNSVNALLANDHLLVHPRCVNLVQSLQRLAWKEGAITTLYANPDYSHFPDGLRYPAEYLYPVQSRKVTRLEKAHGF